MNPIHQCFQKILPGNHFSYVWDVRTDVRTRVMLYAPPPQIINGGGIITETNFVKTCFDSSKMVDNKFNHLMYVC